MHSVYTDVLQHTCLKVRLLLRLNVGALKYMPIKPIKREMQLIITFSIDYYRDMSIIITVMTSDVLF